jgi:hypothetical protein
MRRFAVIAALGILPGMPGGVVTASSAPARGPQWHPFPNKPFTLNASFCVFKFLWDAPVNKAFMKIPRMPG